MKLKVNQFQGWFAKYCEPRISLCCHLASSSVVRTNRKVAAEEETAVVTETSALKGSNTTVWPGVTREHSTSASSRTLESRQKMSRDFNVLFAGT